ncbi:hypothetical protein Dimus_022645 [Dionaea muscipula]
MIEKEDDEEETGSDFLNEDVEMDNADEEDIELVDKEEESSSVNETATQRKKKKTMKGKTGLFPERKVVRGLVFDSVWMSDNGLEKLSGIIDDQGWSKLFGNESAYYPKAVKEFYKNLTVRYEHFDVPLTVGDRTRATKRDLFKFSVLIKHLLEYVNGVWWFGRGENKRRDVDDEAPTDIQVEEEVAATAPGTSIVAVPDLNVPDVHPAGPTDVVQDADSSEDDSSGKDPADIPAPKTETDPTTVTPSATAIASPSVHHLLEASNSSINGEMEETEPKLPGEHDAPVAVYRARSRADCRA